MEKQIYDFKGNTLDVYLNEKGEPMFIAKQVMQVLELTHVTNTLRSLDEDEKLNVNILHAGQNRNVIMLTESGLYTLVIKSTKPEAKVFRKWVTSEVLPSIRKHDGYLTPRGIEETLSNPDFIIKLATKLKEEQQARELAEIEAKRSKLIAEIAHEKIEADKPKVDFADLILESKDSIDVGTFATRLKQQGYDTGRNRMYKTLIDNDYLIKSGHRRKQPKINFVGMGIFEVKTSVYNDKVTYQTLITPKGQKYLMERILEK